MPTADLSDDGSPFLRDSVLQIRGTEDDLKIFFLFLSENICCDSSLELYEQDTANERPQDMF